MHAHGISVTSIERKGFVTEADLEAYAKTAGLPASYAKNFASAVLATGTGSGRSSPAGALGRHQRGISFPAFLAFVKTREAALRAAFNHFGALSNIITQMD